MLPSADTLKQNILSLKPTKNSIEGITAFVEVIADFMNLVQAGPTGSTGIFTFNNSAMISIMETMKPVKDNSWIANFANAWEAGVSGGIISPGTVTDPTWIGSGNKDIETLPSASATIINITSAKAHLISNLSNINISNAPLPFATAIRNATLIFQFNCIGLGSPPSFTPIPIVFSAQ